MDIRIRIYNFELNVCSEDIRHNLIKHIERMETDISVKQMLKYISINKIWEHF
jgi:hypothetical protein